MAFIDERSTEKFIEFIEGGWKEHEDDGEKIMEDLSSWFIFFRKMIEPPWIVYSLFCIQYRPYSHLYYAFAYLCSLFF
jgi:hypothetical protein